MIEGRDGRHGRTAHLAAESIDDLVAFLRELDEQPVSPPPSVGCAAAPFAEPPIAWPALAILLVAVRRAGGAHRHRA